MSLLKISAAAAIASAIGGGAVLAQEPATYDGQPRVINGVETACDGVGLDQRSQGKWRDFPLRIEFVGKGGQYLGDEHVNVKGHGFDVSVHCLGPWVMMKLPAGTYRMSADVTYFGHRNMTLRVPGHHIVRFPEAGGQTTPREIGPVATR